MVIKNPQDLKTYKKAASISLDIQRQLMESIKVGILPIEIDKLAGQLCKKYKVTPAFYGVGSKENLFKNNLCLAVNDEILHAIPSSTRTFQIGDLIKVDFGITYKGYKTDHCFTVGLGKLSTSDSKLLQVGRASVENALEYAKAGNTTGDLGYIMQTTAEKEGFNVLKHYVGHGIGRSLWERPEIPAHGKKGKGDVLEDGMVICIESQVVSGSDEVYTDKDGWTIKSKDKSKGVMYEYMVVITKDKPIILTNTLDWDNIIKTN